MNPIYDHTSLNSSLSHIIYDYTLWKERPFTKELKYNTKYLKQALDNINKIIKYRIVHMKNLLDNWYIIFNHYNDIDVSIIKHLTGCDHIYMRNLYD